MKRIFLILLAILFALNACAFAAEWPITITDQAGREVTIAKEPESIVSGYYIATSTLIALDCDDRLVGVEAKAQKRAIYALSAPQLIDLPNVGSAKEFDLETCASLNPDLLVLPLRLTELAPKLDELGLTYIFVNPESQDLLQESIALLGAATGCDERAQQLNDFINENLQSLAAAVEGAEKPLVYLSGNSAFLNTAGPAMYQHTLIQNAGGENAAQDFSDSYWANVSYEQLLAWNPDAIVMAADADYTLESVLEDANLAACSAVESGRVYQIPYAIESWDSPVPGSFLASLWLASELHPDCFTASDYEATAIEFYEHFYGFTPEIAALQAAA